jgi:hypothetical protein
MIGCTREVDSLTGVVRFVKAGKPIWDTHPVEKDRLIYQIGSASPELAVEAAKLVEQDVAGVDLNCGCPKRKLSCLILNLLLIRAQPFPYQAPWGQRFFLLLILFARCVHYLQAETI